MVEMASESGLCKAVPLSCVVDTGVRHAQQHHCAFQVYCSGSFELRRPACRRGAKGFYGKGDSCGHPLVSALKTANAECAS